MRSLSRAARAFLVVLALMAGLVRPARAQNLRDVPLGGRTATMGGAGVAAGRDHAMPFLNPAGIAGTPTDVLSLSAAVYGYAAAPVRDYYVPERLDAGYGTDLDISVERHGIEWLAITPATAAYLWRVDRDGEDSPLHAFALSITTATYNVSEGSGSFRAQGSQARLQQDDFFEEKFVQYFAGPSYALGSSQGRLRLGVSALLSFSQLMVDDHRLLLVSRRAGAVEFPQTVNQRFLVDAWSLGLSAIAGVQVEAHPGWWLGAAFEWNGLPLTGGGTFAQVTDSSVIDPTSLAQTAERSVLHGEFRRFDIARPPRLSLGIARETRWFALAADLHFRPRWREFLNGELDASVTVVRTGAPVATSRESASFSGATLPTLDASIGLEYAPSQSVALRLGAFSDRDVGERRDQDGQPNGRLDWYGVTAGLGVLDGSLETTYGIGYRYGVGRAVSVDAFSSSPGAAQVPYVAHGLMLILSGSVRTSEGERKRVLRELGRVPR